MKTYDFTFELTGLVLDQATSDLIYESGFDDVTLCFRDGVLRMSFDREAESELRAVADTIYDLITKVGYETLKIVGTKELSEKDIACLESMILFSDML